MRSEDIAARIGVAKFAVLLPMTSQVKSLVVIHRIREAVDNLVFDTGGEKVRVSLSVGYSSLVHDKTIDFDGMLNQADDALLRALGKSSGDKVVAYVDEEAPEEEPKIEEADLHQALESILQGDYYQLEEKVLQPLVDRLMPFIDYVNNQGNDDGSVDQE